MARDRNLTLFLQHFSYGTQVFTGGGAVAFVEELSQRYLKRHPRDEPANKAAPVRVPVREMVPGSIFLSYASQDLRAVSRIAESLRDMGADVWLDKSDLKGGDAWHHEIQRRIRHCSYFLPVISHTTQERDEGYFRKEWRWAAERTHGMADSVSFLVPLLLDDIPMEDAKVPEVFRERQAFLLHDGAPTEAFRKRMVELIRSCRKREKLLKAGA